jgi:phosphoglycerol transferase MdoB-like AlkP superfamily enzyme
MSQKLKNVLTILLVYVSSIILALILAIITGSLYSNIFNLSCTGSIFVAMNFDKGCQIEGFIYTYSFLLPLLSFSLLKTKKAWLNYFFGIILFVVLFLFVGYYKGLVIYLLMLIFAWLLAQGGLLVYERFKK